MKTTIFVVLCAAVLISCAPPTPPPPDVAAVRKTIESMLDKAEKNMMAGVIDTTLADYTDDAVSMPNYGPMSKGKAAIRAQYAQMMGMGMKFSSVDFVTQDVKVDGKYAYEIGTYAMTMEMAGMPAFTDKGKYLSVYERGTDGKWLTKVETWNTDTPMPMGGEMPEPEKKGPAKKGK